jgi:lipid A 3-O-deacylase
MTAHFHFGRPAPWMGSRARLGLRHFSHMCHCFPRNLFALACAAPFVAHAAGWVPDGMFIEGGFAPSSSHSVTAGAMWTWDWQARFGNTQATALTEVYVSRWSARGQSVTQAALVPLLRLRLDHGRSPWFMEGGIGVSMMDSLYRNHGKEFTTRFNFVDVFGVGRSLGADRRREVSVRLAHISNANLKQPNPGENFLQLRYAVKF